MPNLNAALRRLPGLLALSLAASLAACGGSETEERNLAIEITGARWTEGRVIVYGSWMKGLSTPPSCGLLESPGGDAVVRFSPERASFDGNKFTQEVALKQTTSNSDTSYYVRCSVSLDSAKTASDTAQVEGTG
jgi:hypothetical protein